MNDDGRNISQKTWNRAIQPIHKMGYMDGAADGQKAVFQSSFDMGYSQGLSFGIQLGYKKAMSTSSETNPRVLSDTQNVNCQICINQAALTDNVGNLYNNQEEKNLLFLKQ